MANIEDIIKILKKGIRFGAVGRVSGKQIVEASDQILKSSIVTGELLEQIGRELAGDRLLFNDVDVDQLQKLLEKKKMPEVVEEIE